MQNLEKWKKLSNARSFLLYLLRQRRIVFSQFWLYRIASDSRPIYYIIAREMPADSRGISYHCFCGCEHHLIGQELYCT
jgi:hypothetical protein